MWGVAVVSFAAGAAVSLVNQMIFGNKDDTATSIVAGIVISGLTTMMGVMGKDYISITENYNTQIKRISKKISDPIEAISYHIKETERYNKEINNLVKVNTISTATGTLVSNVTETICSHIDCRVIGWRSEYDPKTGVRKQYQIYSCY